MLDIIPSSGHSAWLSWDGSPLGPFPIVAFMVETEKVPKEPYLRALKATDRKPDLYRAKGVYALVLDPEFTDWHRLNYTAFLSEESAKAAVASVG